MRNRSLILSLLGLQFGGALPAYGAQAGQLSVVSVGDPSPLEQPARLAVDRVWLSDALNALQSRSGVSIVYSPSLLPRMEVTCHCKALTVGEALDRLIDRSRMRYTVHGQHIIVEVRNQFPLDRLRSVQPELTPFSTTAEASMNQSLFRSGRALLAAGFLVAAGAVAPQAGYAQNHVVSGRVTSSELAPLMGVNVVVKGTTIGTITNAAGDYSLTAPSSADTLVFSTLGYRSQEIAIAGRTAVNATMQEAAVALEGVVVVGYGTQSRATVSGSVSSITSEEIERTSATTAAEALAGKLQGINTRLITTNFGTTGGRAARGTDGRPGAATTIQIRNMGSPLFVIDGVPSEEDAFQHLNPSDIESVSVLKDASASVYGFRAANGVILVTTKRGSATRPQVRIDGYYGLQNLDRYPYERMSTAYQYIEGIVESQQNRGQPRSVDPEELARWRLGTEPGYQSFDAYSAIVNNRNAAQYNINTSVSGAAGDARYYLSFAHVNQDYVMRDNNFNRSNLQANLSATPLENLTLDAKVRARQEFTTNFALSGSNDIIRTALLGINSTWPHESPWADPERRYIAFDQRYLARSPASYNKESSGWQDDTIWDFNGTFFAEYALPFSTTLRGSYSRTANLRNFDQHRYTFDAYRYNPETDGYDVVGSSGSASRFQSRTRNHSSWTQLMLNTSQQFGEHTLSGVAAYERNGGEVWTTEVSSVPPGNFTHLIDFADATDLGTAWDIQRRASYVGRLNYDYAQRYLVEALGRYDGSYLFPPDKRWGFFPGVSLGWRISEEGFFRDNVGFLDELKLRASWGQAGRELLPGNANWTYLAGATYGGNAGRNAMLDGGLVTGIAPRGIPVTNLSWVKSTTRNLGLDFQMFGQRLSGEFDLFERKLTGLPAARYDVVIPTEVGYTLPDENLESEATRGVEGILRFTDSFRGVSYSLAPHATLARNRILDRYKPRYGNSWDRYRNGTEHRWDGVTSAFGYEVLGQFQTVEEIANHPIDIDAQGNRTLLPGDLIYKDQNGDGIINAIDQRPLGFPTQTTPLVSYGLNTSLGWRGLSLSADFAGGGLFSYLQVNEQRFAFFGNHNAQAFFQDRWRRADPYDDQSEWIPGRFPALRKGVTNHAAYAPTSDYWRTNVRFLRLKRIELGYSVPNDLSRHVGLSQLRVYTSGSNLFSFDNVSHLSLDPEIVQGNGLNYPTSTVVNLGFSATVGGAPLAPAPVVPIPAGPEGSED